MGYRATVIGGSLNLRSQPDINSSALASIPNGTQLSVTQLQTPILWRRTYYQQKIGYVLEQYLNITSTVDNLIDACIYFGAPHLKEGSQGNYVLKLQNFLVVYDHANIAQDGAFGPQTKQAVIDYQTTRGLGVDGVVGPATKTKMWNEKEYG